MSSGPTRLFKVKVHYPATVNQATSAPEADGVVHVALDEAFSPLLAVGAVAVEHEFLRVNIEIEDLYHDLKGAYYLNDLKSFEEFSKNGFHAAVDPYEISSKFIDFLSKTIGFKSFIYFTDGTRRPDLSPKKAVLMLYGEIVKTVLYKYHSRPKIVLHFEQHQELNRFFEPLVLNILRRMERRRPIVQVIAAKKMDPPLLAIADYVLHTFVRWHVGSEKYPPETTSAKDRPWREMRAIRPSISVVRSLEKGTIARRNLPGTVDATI
jgi:hypothetical protein